ncbi:ATP-binding cassette domain-containing protein, partial [Algiphilus sp. NNCM1]|nr:ATP-binding cassette domain-containing protein [Algiphilus acroporae]
MTDATEPFAISISQLRKCFDHVAALEGLDLHVAHGCIFGLLGPNGAGKSTAIKMLTTLLDPTSGSATVAGFDIARQPVEVRRHIGYVPQMLSADGALTAIENLNLSARLHGLHGSQRRARVKDAIAFAGLEASASKL